jgi:hypothetical protein
MVVEERVRICRLERLDKMKLKGQIPYYCHGICVSHGNGVVGVGSSKPNINFIKQ